MLADRSFPATAADDDQYRYTFLTITFDLFGLKSFLRCYQSKYFSPSYVDSGEDISGSSISAFSFGATGACNNSLPISGEHMGRIATFNFHRSNCYIVSVLIPQDYVVSLYSCFNNNTLGRLWTSSMPYLFPFIVEYRFEIK